MLKEAKWINHCFVAQTCKCNFSLVLFKYLACSPRCFDHCWLALPFCPQFFRCKLTNEDFTPPVPFEGRVRSECVSNVSGHSGCVYACVLVEGMLCNLWAAGVKRGVFQHCSVKWLLQYTHTSTTIHAAQWLYDCFAKTRTSVWRGWWGVESVFQTILNWTIQTSDSQYFDAEAQIK